MADAENYTELVGEALELYGLSGHRAEFIRHNENLTYRVGGRYLLRIHKSKDDFSAGDIYDLDPTARRESEIELLMRLSASGLDVQTPVRTTAGSFIGFLKDGTPVTLLNWIEGRTLGKNDLTPPLCRKLGEMAAKLHKASRGYSPECAIRYDEVLCLKLKPAIEALAEYVDVRFALAALDACADNLARTEDMFLPVHSDLSLSNILLTKDGVVPIDFSLFGVGHPMSDIGGLFCSVSGGINRKAIIDGYVGAGGEYDGRAADCAFALNVILGIVLHSKIWPHEDWFAEKFDGWSRTIFAPVSEGVPMTKTGARASVATEDDIDAWLDLVRLVADDFPGLDIDDYTVTLKKNIKRETALCVREDGKLAGVLLCSPKQNCLSFLAVHPDYRRYGAASALISEMLRRMTGDVYVTTYREGDPKGGAPRALYKKFGFVPCGLAEEFGYPVERFVLRRG